MINVEEEYLGLMSGILHGGNQKKSRAGDTRSVFGRQLRHDMALGFPLLTTKKIYIKNAITEILWILQGRTDMEYLHSHGLKYWDADYERSGRKDGSLGSVYGKQFRDFHGTDQLEDLIEGIRENPTSRRLMVNLWNPSDLPDMVLPPCHYGFQVYIHDGWIDLMWNQRSADVFLGLPYDIAMYGLLLEMLAKGSELTPGQLICNLGDCHLYENHIKQATKQLQRKIKPLPILKIENGIYKKDGVIMLPTHKDVVVTGYDPHPPIKAPLSVGI